jgi:hypothetical protein
MTQQEKIAAALTRAGITKPEAWAAAGVPLPNSSLPHDSLCDVRSHGESSSAGPARAPVAAEAAHEADSQTATIALPDSVACLSNDQHQAKAASADNAASLTLMKGEANSTFVISYRSRQELAGPRAWKSVAMLIGGLALSTLGGYVLYIRS